MRKFVSFSKYFTDITKDKKIIDCSKILALIPQCYDLFLHSLAFIPERISSYDEKVFKFLIKFLPWQFRIKVKIY